MKILIVDDHSLVRDAISSVLSQVVSEMTLVQASTKRMAESILEQTRDINLVLLDINLPDGSGLSLLTRLRERAPDTAVIILSADCDPKLITSALASGAKGFIPKSSERAVIAAALQVVLAGGVYVPAEILPRTGTSNASVEQRDNEAPPITAFDLTSRQMEILRLIVQGKSNKAIAQTLRMAEATVKNHITAILRRLNVENRTEAAIMVRDRGLISL